MDNLLEYENLVNSIVHKYCGKFEYDDLYQVGMMGLINASKNYSDEFDVKFSSYAYFYINGEVLKYIRDNKTIKVSRDIIKLNSKIEKTRDLMRQRLGRDPTDTEVSLFLDIEEEKIIDVKNSMIEVRSLDYEYEENDYYNLVGCEDKNMDIDIINLRGEIDKLDNDEKSIIRKRYYDDLTQSEVSRDLGISQVQVSRKETKVLEKLKTRMI